MKIARLWAAAGCVLAAVPLCLPGLAHAADWPTRAVRIIVPAPAGGPFDRTIRPIAQRMSETLQQPVVIDNRPSAGNIVGTQVGATAIPDGYTITMTGMVNALAAGMYDNVPFDIVRDFAHVGAIGQGIQWLAVRSDAGIRDLPDLIRQARQQPGKINYATSGAGSSGHLLMELLQKNANIQLTHVPYKGGAPALQDVLAGVVPVIVLPQITAVPAVQGGKLVALASSRAQRDPLFTQVPTFAELGYAPLTVSTWVGLSAPKGTPPEIVAKLNAALQRAVKDPAAQKQLQIEGIDPMETSPEQYTQLVRDETAKWTDFVRKLNIKAN